MVSVQSCCQKAVTFQRTLVTKCPARGSVSNTPWYTLTADQPSAQLLHSATVSFSLSGLNSVVELVCLGTET